MRRTSLILLIALSACAHRQPVAAPSPVALPLDASGIDHTVAPGDDFFAYANGAWVKQTEIPADQSAWGLFALLAEETNLQTRGLLEQAATAAVDSDARRAGDFYASFMDEAAIEQKGWTPLTAKLAAVTAIKDKKALARALGAGLRADVDPLNETQFHTSRLFGLWVSPALEEPTRVAAYLLQGGIGLPDREYYVSDTPRMATIREQYKAHIATVLGLLGHTDAAAQAARIFALETKIAQAHATRTDSMDVHKANNPWARTAFSKKAPGLDWASYFAAAGLDKQQTIIVWHPQATTGLAALVGTEPLSTWKEWLAFHTVERVAGYLSKPFADEAFAFYGKTLQGTLEIRARWKRGVSATNGALRDAVGKLYVDKYFRPETKAQLEGIVKNVVAAFDARIGALTWMDDKTKAEARRKLKTLYVGVGYPEHFVEYGGLAIAHDDLVGNVERAELFRYKQRVAKLGSKADVTEWAMPAQIVNAVNLPIQNALNFPAAVLRPPFFDPAAPAAANYGAIGAVIGHEISHSFDDQGALFDSTGKLANWWTKDDFSHFTASSKKLIAQFDAYAPFPDLHVNGALTVSENIADLAGLSAAHDAWLTSLGGKPAAVVDGMSGEQQFFFAFGRSWRTKMREPALRQRIVTDGHAPGMFRADTVRNIDAWYDAFGVKAGQHLFLAPDDRVHIW